ncbi:MAG: gluconokinase, partial [Lactobacillaceae bacterium]|nr:gluconokinase [Lactobacillaceae bacterium]
MEYFIGVDLGTTSTKAVLFDKKGTVIATANHGYELYRDAIGMAEEDLDEIFDAFSESIREITHKINFEDGDQLSAISFSSAMHSLIAFDDNWNPLTRVITWADTRAVDFTEQLKENGLGQQIYEKTGTPIHPMAPLSKLLWLKDNQPEVFQKAKHYLGIKEYIFHRLFGSNKMDYSIASGTGLFNIFNLDWDQQALSTTNIVKEQLPKPVSPYEIERGLINDYDKILRVPKDAA